MLKAPLAIVVIIAVSVANGLLEPFGADWEVRLVGGPLSNEGRLEVRPPDGEWGSVCYRNSSDPDVDVVRVRDLACGMCWRMGHLASYTASNHQYDYGTSGGVIWYNGGNCNCGQSECRVSQWSLNRFSCDHRSDISMTCLTVAARLSGGSTEREGWLEVGLGGDRWVSVGQPFPHSIKDADLMCRHLGYPLALSTSGNFDLPSPGGSDPEMGVRKYPCRPDDTSLVECLGRSICNNVCDRHIIPVVPPLGVKCALDEEVIAPGNTQTIFPEGLEVRLGDGGPGLTGTLQLRSEGSSWGPACFYDDELIHVVADDVCHHYGSPFVLQTALILVPLHDAAVEYLFRVGRHEETHWLQVQNHCARNGGKVLSVSCKRGFTFHGFTVFLPDIETCEGRCGQPPARYPACGCDTLCHALRDCCFDVLTACPSAPPTADSNQQQSSLYNLTTSSQYYECLSIDSRGFFPQLHPYYQLISRCPESWQNNAVREHCKFPFYTQPVFYETEDLISIPFKNVMCAYCHGLTAFRIVEGDPVYFQPTPGVPESDNASTSVVDDLPPPNVFVSIIEVFAFRLIDNTAPVDRALLHACIPSGVVSKCPSGDDIPDGLREACAAYSAEVLTHTDQRTFKNPHCALCNGIAIDDIIVAPTLYTPDPDDSGEGVVYELALAGPQEIEDTRSLTITLGEEIACLAKDFGVSVRVHLDKDIRSMVAGDSLRLSAWTAFSSMECLFRGIAFSDIDIAAEFGQALEQSKVLNNNGTEDIVRVTRPEFGYSSEFEAVLNCILQTDDCPGDGEGIDWRRRCNAAEITLGEECSLGEDYAAGECFQTSAANMTTATINDTLYLYINGGVLITPLNISFFTSYTEGDETAHFTKQKFIQACGVRSQDISCEILPLDHVDFIQDGDSRLISYHNLVLNESSYAVLPDGDVIVCTITKTFFQDPFTGPDYVVNVVCLALSLMALAATIVTYCVFPALRNVHGLTVMSLSASIFVGQALFLFGLNQTGNPGVCAAVAITAHYAWLAAFAWMTALAWDLMRTFSGPVNRDHAGSRLKFLRLSLFGWCSPFLVLIPCLVVYFCDCTGLSFSYGRVETRICWISDSTAVLVSFGLPIGSSLCLNILLFLLTVRAIRVSKKASSLVNKDKSRRKEVSKELTIYIKISSVMGFAWIIGFVALATNIQVLWFLFAIVGSLQGVYIFTSFAFNSRVRAMWRGKLRPKKQKTASSADGQTPQKGVPTVSGDGTISTSL